MLAFGRNADGQIDRTLKEALAEKGLVESRNINIVYRYANANSVQLSPLADELVALKPNILIGIGARNIIAESRELMGKAAPLMK